MRRTAWLALVGVVLALAVGQGAPAESRLSFGRSKGDRAARTTVGTRAARSLLSPPQVSISLSWGWPSCAPCGGWQYLPPSAFPAQGFYYYAPFAYQPYIANSGYYFSGVYVFPNIIGPPQAWLPARPVFVPVAAPPAQREPEQDEQALSPFQLQPRSSPRLAQLEELSETADRDEPEAVVLAARSGLIVELLPGRRVRLTWSSEQDVEAVGFALLASHGRSLDRAVVRRAPFIAVLESSYLPLKARATVISTDGSSTQVTLPLSSRAK
jgi:hypothetical protein